MPLLDFSENEDQYLERLIDRNTDQEENYNAVTITQTFEATIKTYTYHDEDEAEDMADGLELEVALRDTIKALKGHIEGKHLQKWEAQKLVRQLERYTSTEVDYTAEYIIPVSYKEDGEDE